MKKFILLAVVCLSFPCFAVLHLVSRSAKATYSGSKASAHHAKKHVANPLAKSAKFAAKQVF